MKQTEIFQNMTKGEWYLSGSPVALNRYKIPFKSVKTSKGIGGVIIASVMGNTLPPTDFPTHAERKKLNAEANAAVIVSAVNNTYGKGINPESVEKMRDALSFCQSVIKSQGMFDLSERTAYDKAEEALTAAKL